VKIISFNVNGIRAAAKKDLLGSIARMNPDIIGFQETKATPEQVRETLFGIGDYELRAHSAERPGYSGTAILSRTVPQHVQFGIGVDEHDHEGRVITAEYADFFLVNVYVPNSGNELVRLDYRETWDVALLSYVKGLECSKPVILIGDMNVAHRPIDIKNAQANYNKTSGYTQREIDGMDRYLASGLVDTFRHLHPEEVKYSWWSYRMSARERNIGWRIDYILVSQSLLPRVKEAFILNEVEGSDHCPVGVVLVD
jgi:exodeoxyribonuclease III